MARKKAARKKKKGKKSLLLWFFLLLLLLCSIAATVYLVFLRPGTIKPLSPPIASVPKKKPAPIPAKPAVPPPLITSLPSQKSPATAQLPLISIIIDDMGFQDKICADLIALDLNLSFAFLPFGPHTAAQLAEARRKDRDILLHLPMEPQDSKWTPGPGALLTAMDSWKIQSTLARDIAAVPHAIGVNNHMGSSFTENRIAMQACLALLKNNNLFFLDSLTSANSVGFSMAREMGMRSAQRDIFIDNSQDAQQIMKQLDALISLARKRGSAIGIGHPHPATLAALRKYQSKLQGEIQLVGVSRLAK
ncbi:MAG: divergent polysaccharide deacetylase family protein [Proteobacteria bacterium]|nr:divergent polysaccharide deacetylase family protein [Pseudomonadota bacterium]MBU4297345.1 divergent polysaccharide deacetylase family protein [Pseudomonadota bacterium]MCG2748956.1 divergent polysaccharide deacetylase family protein [Desulfobulbaceae bacterium]